MAINWDEAKSYNWTVEDNLLKTKSFSLSLNDIESFSSRRPFWTYIYEFLMGTFLLGLIMVLFDFDWKLFLTILGILFAISFALGFLTKAKILDIQAKGSTYRMSGWLGGELSINRLIIRLDRLLSSK